MSLAFNGVHVCFRAEAMNQAMNICLAWAVRCERRDPLNESKFFDTGVASRSIQQRQPSTLQGPGMSLTGVPGPLAIRANWSAGFRAVGQWAVVG